MTQQEANQITQFIQGLVGDGQVIQGVVRQPEDQPRPDAMVCKEHGEPMERGVSKTKFKADGTPKSYWYHRVNGSMCFGEGVKV